MSYQTAQVAGMIVHGNTAIGVVEHQLVDFVHTAGNGLHQTAAPDDCIEVHGHVCPLQLVEHQLFAESPLLYHIVELCQILICVHNVAQQNGLFVVVDGQLGGSGTRIDNKNQHRRKWCEDVQMAAKASE